MGLSLWNLFEAILLVINAVAILHEERFLAKSKRLPCSANSPSDVLIAIVTVGWGRHQTQMNQQHGGYGHAPAEPGLKANLMNLIHSIRTVMRGKLPMYC